MKSDFYVIELIEKDVVHVKFCGVSPDINHFERYLSELSRVIRSQKGLYIIYDARFSHYLSNENRQRMAFWIGENEAMLQENVRVAYHIIPNAVQRAIYQGIYAIRKSPVPFQLSPSLDQVLQHIDRHRKQSRFINHIPTANNNTIEFPATS